MTTIRLGREGTRRDAFRGGSLVFLSRKGVPKGLGALIETLPADAPARVLVGHDPDGVLALAAAALWPLARIHDHHLDAWVGAGAFQRLQEASAANVVVHVEPDLPFDDGGPFDLAVLPFPAQGDALLGREWIEQAHDRLAPDGRLLAGTDGGPGWLRKVVKEVFGRSDLMVPASPRGAVVAARRRRSELRTRDHAHAFRIERGGRTLELVSRPGVFSHGRLDQGTRALLDAFEARPGMNVLDLGCGSGALGLAAAVDAGPDGVVMVDSNARAVALARDNAARNGLDGVTVCLRTDLEDLPGGPFDLVLANPPYFSRGRIARSFARCAAARATSEGTLLMVAKAVDLHLAILEESFAEVRATRAEGYGILRARRPRRRPP